MNRKTIIVGTAIVLMLNIAGYILVCRSHTADQRAFDRWNAAVQQEQHDFKAVHAHQKIDEKYLGDYAELASIDSAKYKSEQNLELRWRSDIYFFLQMANLFAALIAISKLLKVAPKSTVLRPSAA